jgi:uncharacterized membrane protein YfcA
MHLHWWLRCLTAIGGAFVPVHVQRAGLQLGMDGQAGKHGAADQYNTLQQFHADGFRATLMGRMRCLGLGFNGTVSLSRLSMDLPLLHALLAVLCGSVVGFSLALIGGGGSILAVPLLLYVVGLHDPHTAIGTSAVAVAVNAFANLIPHARAGNVRWPAAFMFAATGVLGAFLGSSLGKLIDGHRLLMLFALLMLVIAGLMLRGRRGRDGTGYPHRHMFPRLAVVGLGAGSVAGFFGIGGGFLIVPGLVFASGMAMIEAIGTSLFCVGSFGLTAAINYAVSGLVAWPIALEFIAGGIAGGWLGTLGVQKLSRKRGALTVLFAAVIVAVALFMLAKSVLR